ncbi:hypothetical protein PLEOSDRAFT_41920 [Pleurotus ostreatus PC15]|uniref:FAD-binding PCMH-type domain-containing protein n=1 Tax=Pleurotus ostreatus (strain PC15) TaxID=1137138 RepID=A0A067NEG7_PLEO1|nr:hypothetical protein PLEOSDRAFT_41920 [Pleurotus ostreatus PC15]
MGFLQSWTAGFCTHLLWFLTVSNPPTTLGQDGLLECLGTGHITTVPPGSPDFPQDSLAFNRRLQYTPAAIVFPTSAQEVSAAVLCAAGAGIHVAARSGGHNYGAFSLGGQNGSLVVDLSKMNKIVVNANGTASFQTGNRLGDVALTLFDNGERAMAHGTCPHVGSGGHAGCGGFGFASRMWGLLIDQVESAEVVLANGSIVQTSTSINSDLFWAIRGASPSFGIVTEYRTKTHAAPSENVIFTYTYLVDPAAATKIFTEFQSFSKSLAPPELGLQVSVRQYFQRGVVHMNLTGVYYGGVEHFHDVFDPLLSNLSSMHINHNYENVTTYAWVPSLIQLSEVGTLNTSSPILKGSHDTFFAKSLMVYEDALLKDEAIQSFFNYVSLEGVHTLTSWFVLVDLFGGKGSAITAVANNATAYSQRKGLYNFQMYARSPNHQPPFPTDGLAFVNNMLGSITGKMPPNWPFGAFTCYTDPTLEPKQWQSQYYGENFSKLTTLHFKYDSKSLFNYPQGIPNPLLNSLQPDLNMDFFNPTVQKFLNV